MLHEVLKVKTVGTVWTQCLGARRGIFIYPNRLREDINCANEHHALSGYGFQVGN